MTKTLLFNTGILTMDAQRRVYDNGAVLIDDDRILNVGPSENLLSTVQSGPDVQLLDFQGRWVLPGLINTHVHLSQQLARGLADDVDLLTWLHDRIWPYESNMTESDSYISSLLCGIELIRSGVTCLAEPGGQHVDGMGQAISKLGLRGILARSTMDMGEGLPPAWQDSTDEALDRQLAIYDQWQGRADGRIQVWLGLRTIFNNSDDLIIRTKQLADDLGVGVHMHVAEVKEEIEFARRTRGASTVTHLENLGVLDKNFLAVHSVWLDQEEIGIFAERDVKVSHCPAAAMRVLGFPKIPEMIAAGVCVTLGTDGAPTNNRMTLVDEMWLTSLIHKGRMLDPTAMPAENVLAMVTCDGARGLLMEDKIGSLEVGKKADLVVVNPNSATMLPIHDPVASMVSSLRADNIESVMVDGNWIMYDRVIKTVDEDDVLASARRHAEALRERAGIKLPQRFNWIQ